MTLSEWWLIFHGLILLEVMQLIVGSWLVVKLRKTADGGWGLAKVVGWLLISLVAWWMGGLQINLIAVTWIMVGVLVAGGGGWFFLNRREIRKELMRKKWLIAVEETLFIGGYLGLVFIRSFNPDILDLEKFMDGGFIAAYLRAKTLPIEDMWLAGETVNYYTFGHFMGAVWARIWGIDLGYAYNLLLGVLMGVTLSGGFSVVVNLLDLRNQKQRFKKKKGDDRRLIGGGLVGSLLLAIGGNSQAIWYFLKNRSFESYWYADATRFIENTIHEFPSYSFIVSDLHGHLWDLPVVLLFLFLVLSWSRAVTVGEKWWSVGMGVLLGVMAMTNTWDVLIYGMVLLIVGVMLLFWGVSISKLLASAVRVAIFFGLTSIQWWISFESIGEGVRMVVFRSPIWQLIVLWAGHMALMVGAVIVSLKIKVGKTKDVGPRIGVKNLMVVAMVLTAILLIALPELIYVKDIYPNHPRANTMFKLTYQAFVMMSLVGGWVVGETLQKKGVVAKVGLFLALTVAGGLLVFPYFGYRDYYGGLKTQRGLNGWMWLKVEAADDFAAIEWLGREVKDRPVIVEAVGESYTKFGRVSVVSGFPTVLGWRVHEWLWRGGFDIPAARTEEVRLIYEQPKTEEVKGILSKYKVKYVFIGDKEREIYRLDEEGLKSIGKVVFTSGRTMIVAVE